MSAMVPMFRQEGYLLLDISNLHEGIPVLKLSDVQVLPEIENALRPLSDRELRGLKEDIVKERRFLMPLSYAQLAGGIVALVDGHSRRGIWLSDELSDRDDIDEPELQEIASLYGKSIDEAIEWVKRHQAHRRNDESLMATYLAGKEYNDGMTASAVAEKYDMTTSQVRHAAVVAKKIDAAEEEAPGAKEAILDSDLKANHVRKSASSKELVESANVGAPGKSKQDAGPLASFQPMTMLLAKISRHLNAKVNETGENGWSVGIVKNINEINRLIGEWQSSEMM